jgi:hypothetical protein
METVSITIPFISAHLTLAIIWNKSALTTLNQSPNLNPFAQLITPVYMLLASVGSTA